MICLMFIAIRTSLIVYNISCLNCGSNTIVQRVLHAVTLVCHLCETCEIIFAQQIPLRCSLLLLQGAISNGKDRCIWFDWGSVVESMICPLGIMSMVFDAYSILNSYWLVYMKLDLPITLRLSEKISEYILILQVVQYILGSHWPFESRLVTKR